MEGTTVVAFAASGAAFDGLPHVKVIADPKAVSAMEEGYGCYDERGAALSIAQRIASFLSLQDLLAYLSLEEKVKTCCKAYGHVRERADRLLSSLSLLRLIEWGLGVISHIAKGTAVAVVTSVEMVASAGRSIVAQVLRFVDYFVHLAHRVWKELRHLSLVELIRALLILVTERLERDMTSMGSRESGHLSSKDPSSKGGMHTSLKGFLTSSIKDLEDFVAAGGGGEGGVDGPFGDGFTGGGRIPQWNAGLGKPSSKMGLVVAYREKDETLSSVTKQKVRRMMHYQVPLRPFEATIRCQAPQMLGQEAANEEEQANEAGSEEAVLFPSIMCTPQSFPPTPVSRACVMARFSHFSDDVVYLARDQLRLEELVKADDDVTKMAALSLKQQACLAVFNAEDTASGIVLSCGGHCATKVGSSTIYTSTRGMVPVLRNRYVFFQMSIMAEESAVASLCVGLSTPEMPLNTLVGSWKYSIGLCSTGQILLGSRWYGGSTNSFRFGCGCTVGVLVHIDERRSSESWDGELVEAFVRFSVNGVPVTLDSEGGDVSTIFIPKDDDIYPTLTLQSLSTQVLGRFCAPDILHPHRQLIGAPPGVPVYALDGSVILRASDLVSTNLL